MADFDDTVPRDELLLKQAFEWVVRLKSGDATVKDAEALQRWRTESPAHDRSFVHVVRLDKALRLAGGELAEEQSADTTVVPFRPKGQRVVGRRLVLGGAVAASVAGVLMVRPPLKLWPSVTELSADFRTATGELREITMPDGTSLDLNTQTSIVVRSSSDEQRVELISGEATVSAANRPFVVFAGDGHAVASQAKFNIRHLDAAVCVTCLDGVVLVNLRNHRVRLTQKQQVTYSGSEIGQPLLTDPAVVTSWRDRILVFKEEPLVRVIDEVNRYRKGRIILANAKLEDLLVNGVFHIDRLDGVIAQVRGLGAEVTELPGGIVLLS